MRSLSWILVLALSACSSASEGPPSGPDASSVGPDAGDAASPDGAAPSEEETSLEAEVAGVVRPLTRAQFGTDASDGPPTVHIEAYAGGDPACPTASSPTPDRTVVITGVPVTAEPGQVFTKDDGISVSLLDFTGDQLPDKPLASATAATVKVLGIDPSRVVEIDVEATLEGNGSVKGHIYANYCGSLSN